jgi:hypothetical protein
MSPSGTASLRIKHPSFRSLREDFRARRRPGTATYTQMMSLEDSAIRIAVFPVRPKNR